MLPTQMDIEFAYYNLTLRELQEDMGERLAGGGELGRLPGGGTLTLCRQLLPLLIAVPGSAGTPWG